MQRDPSCEEDPALPGLFTLISPLKNRRRRFFSEA
jgi:hypothetical protein